MGNYDFISWVTILNTFQQHNNQSVLFRVRSMFKITNTNIFINITINIFVNT